MDDGFAFGVDLALVAGLDFGAGLGLVMIYAPVVSCDSALGNTVTVRPVPGNSVARLCGKPPPVIELKLVVSAGILVGVFTDKDRDDFIVSPSNKTLCR